MSDKKIALVLSGGGARGAYEAGVLHHLRNAIWPDRHGFSIHSGASAGAINTCYMAANAHNPRAQCENIKKLWENLRSAHIYKGDFKAVAQFILRSTAYTTTHLLGLHAFFKKWTGPAKPFRGLLDTEPFIPFLKKIIDFNQIHKNVHSGPLDAVSIAVTNVGSGRLELFIDKKESVPYTGAYRIHTEPIDWRHAMASAAVPIIFPPVRAGHYFYVDGSIRLNTPMSPAIQLGADRVLILGVKYKGSLESSSRFAFTEPNAYPSFTNMVGRLMNALFLDHIDYDVEQMTRINRIIEWSEKVYGAKYLDELNTMLRQEGIEGDIANRGLKKLNSFSFFPSEDIGKIACERLLELAKHKSKLSQVERFFLKFLEVDPNADVSLLSYIMFEKEYMGRLIEIGIKDCKQRETELGRFLCHEEK